ncbi:hypothetical protein [Capsulimonas corticalis]|uniref:hypothetical protein n=1 Tax=Capsulimonas corticalis TaxID=2219043 RepID=UPI000F6553E6|nr:hypothetical protein [Capsulimonas corticalis]
MRAAHIVALMVKTVSFWCAAQPEIAHLVDKTRGICWKIPEINASEHNTNKLRATLIIYDARLSAKEQIRVLAHEMTHAILWNTEWSFERDFDHHDDYEGFNGSRYDTVDHRIARMVEHIVDNPKFWTEQQD